MPASPSAICVSGASTSYATLSRQIHRSQVFLRAPLSARAGKGGKCPPLPSRFATTATPFPCGEVADGKDPMSHAWPYRHQPPRRPALREDAVTALLPPWEIVELPSVDSGALYRARGETSAVQAVVFQPQGQGRFGSVLPDSLLVRRKPDNLPGPVPFADGCVRTARPDPTSCLHREGPLKPSLKARGISWSSPARALHHCHRCPGDRHGCTSGRADARGRSSCAGRRAGGRAGAAYPGDPHCGRESSGSAAPPLRGGRGGNALARCGDRRAGAGACRSRRRGPLVLSPCSARARAGVSA